MASYKVIEALHAVRRRERLLGHMRSFKCIIDSRVALHLIE
jgi:hypothetical protein